MYILFMFKELHKSSERGTSKLDWLDSHFSFSFARYYNPKRMGFGKLLVLNDDIIAPGKGFGVHPHQNMEIITIPIKGTLAHKDSTGVEEIVLPGEIQVMSAGTGIFHSEYNHSKTESLELFQIWIEPSVNHITPRHDKKSFDMKENNLSLFVSGKKNPNYLFINQKANILIGKFDKDKKTNYKISKGNGVFIFVIEGRIEVKGDRLDKRDAIAISDTTTININILEDSYFIIIEVPMK